MVPSCCLLIGNACTHSEGSSLEIKTPRSLGDTYLGLLEKGIGTMLKVQPTIHRSLLRIKKNF